MAPGRDEQELFHACLEMSPLERAEYLDTACQGDQRLRDRLDRLLAAHDQATGLTLNPLASVLETFPAAIGPYQITGVLGEGGMGMVYEAEQTEPLCRSVALKVVKTGMDSRQVIARFLVERQALAAMDHPYIAKVFDAGHTPSGLPYFVMERVRGVPIGDYCREHRLTLRQKIELFVRVCQAVQHAHQKGVIHRDLKPSNVLIISDSTPPIPKIIDFGIAKAVQTDPGDTPAALTRPEQAMGTPAYMSPEQAARGNVDIDTRTDVYSLGVILYELLTGALPAAPVGPNYAEFLAALARGELEAPRPGALRRELEGDLDWIVTKALEADRERRYDTPVALAQDLERYLHGHPVTARPPTLRYRAGKFVRRYRVQVAAASLAGLALVSGAIAAGVGVVRATRAESVARREAVTSERVSEFLQNLFMLSDPNRAPGSPLTVSEILDRGASKIETELRGEPRAQARLLTTLGHVYESIGKYRESKALGERALAVHQAAGLQDDLETAKTLVNLGRVNQRMGEFEAAGKALDRALNIRTRVLGENVIELGEVLNLQGGLFDQMGKYSEAIAAHRRALAIQERVEGTDSAATYNSWRGLGMVQDVQGERDAALKSFQRALAIAEKRYGDNHPVVADAANNVGLAFLHLKRLEEAQEYYQRALKIRRRVLGREDPSIAFTDRGLARVLMEQGRLEEAVPLYEEAVRIHDAAFGPGNVRSGETLGSLGLLEMRLGRYEQGQRLVDRAGKILERFYGPSHSETIKLHRSVASVLIKAKRYDAAVPHLRAVVLLRDVPPRLAIDLNESTFDPMRNRPSFQALVREAAGGAAPR